MFSSIHYAPRRPADPFIYTAPSAAHSFIYIVSGATPTDLYKPRGPFFGPWGGMGPQYYLVWFCFFFVRCSPQPLDPSTCLVVPQAVGKHWPRFARPFRTHPKRLSMATEWQEKRQQCRVRCCARDLVCAPHRFFGAQVALGPPETENDPKRRSDKQNCRL